MTIFTHDSTSLDDMMLPVFWAKVPGRLILLGSVLVSQTSFCIVCIH